MTFVAIGLSILLLILLIVKIKVEPFLAFLIVSLFAGIILGIPLSEIMGAIQVGIGDLLGSLVLVIVLGAMLGKIVAESGAAQRIATFLLNSFGKKHIPWAIGLTAFVVGITLFFSVGFVLLVPLVFTIAHQQKIPTMLVGVPMLAALSVTHGLLPPHPAPVALVVQFGANMGVTLLYGLLISIPIIIVSGPLIAKTPWIKNISSKPIAAFRGENKPAQDLPSLANSLISALLPVFLLIATSFLLMQVNEQHPSYPLLVLIGDPSAVMLFSLIFATFSLGVFHGKPMGEIMGEYGLAVKEIALVLLIIAGAGAFKEVLVSSGVSADLATTLQNWPIDPIILGWLIAALIRVSIGSATVAALTAAGMVAPLVVSGAANPNLMVLSIGAGSLIFSHFNDGGFWLVKEYFNLSIRQTLLSWSLIETIASVLGLLGVLALQFIV
jgi:Gnt-I system high-affinity gluconate transporter